MAPDSSSSSSAHIHDASALINAKFSDMLIPDAYAYDLSHLSPIDRLPVELLIDIFVVCARDTTASPLTPLLLSHVCREWRDVVLACPRIWQFVSLTDTRSQLSTEGQCILWAARSKHLPLDVRIEIDNVDRLLPLMIPLFPQIRRWRQWNFTGKFTEDVDFNSFSKDDSYPILDELRLTIRGPGEFQEIYQGSSRARVFDSDQQWLKPEVHLINIHIDIQHLPPSDRMSTFHLRHLTISESTIEVSSDPVRMLEFLQFCPSIESFHYYGFPHDPPSHAETPARPPIVTLQHLRVLLVRSTCAVRTILSHIMAPLLSELYLEHTNMEFEPDVATYPYEPEDGDSDDENQDFSQSPWSDHATGMGLRSLIRRSNPPLQVLAMDYADMRTKDFEWCFDRMDSLLEFRIVASDMSDKVIAMLAPYAEQPSLPASPIRPVEEEGEALDNPDTDSSDGGGSNFPSPTSDGPPAHPFPDASSTPLQVRMPRLTSLELWNCQRLTGDAIVHALRARTRYTDEMVAKARAAVVGHDATDGGTATTFLKLEEVAVIGCNDFYPRHAVDLGITLGNRLRIH